MTPVTSALLVLATEGVEGIPGSHIAAKLAVPLGIVIFCGSVFALLWSNFGARKAALIYSTAFFGFTFMLGIMWWFGAPGTPVATGVQNFPGQEADAYTAHWFAFEPGSETATYFPATNNLGDFVPVAELLDLQDASEEALVENPMFNAVQGDVAQAVQLMNDLLLRIEDGSSQLGGQARAEYQEAGQQGLVDQVGAETAESYSRSDPFYTTTLEQPLATKTAGTLVAGGEFVVNTNWVNEAGEKVVVPVATETMFAFKQPAALWFPSAVWTGVSLLLTLLSLFGLDRLEQREKRVEVEIDEPESLAVPINQ